MTGVQKKFVGRSISTTHFWVGGWVRKVEGQREEAKKEKKNGRKKILARGQKTTWAWGGTLVKSSVTIRQLQKMGKGEMLNPSRSDIVILA